MPGDARDACGCHRECTTYDHECDVPCQWPSCLSEAEQQELADSICQGCYGEAVRTAGPYRLCEECRWEGE